MSKNINGWVGKLVTVGALGAMAGMLAWRFSQRHRMQRQSFYRDLSRWEGEGGSLADTSDTSGENGMAAEMAMAGGGAVRERSDMSGHGVKGAMPNGASGASVTNGAAGSPWPFPHG